MSLTDNLTITRGCQLSKVCFQKISAIKPILKIKKDGFMPGGTPSYSC